MYIIKIATNITAYSSKGSPLDIFYLYLYYFIYLSRYYSHTFYSKLTLKGKLYPIHRNLIDNILFYELYCIYLKLTYVIDHLFKLHCAYTNRSFFSFMGIDLLSEDSNNLTLIVVLGDMSYI